MIITTNDKTYKGEAAPTAAPPKLSEMTVSTLREMAKEEGITGASKMKKDALIAALS